MKDERVDICYKCSEVAKFLIGGLYLCKKHGEGVFI